MTDEELEICALDARCRFDARRAAAAPAAAAPPSVELRRMRRRSSSQRDRRSAAAGRDVRARVVRVLLVGAQDVRAHGIAYRSVDLDSVEYQRDDRGGKIRAALSARTGDQSPSRRSSSAASTSAAAQMCSTPIKTAGCRARWTSATRRTKGASTLILTRFCRRGYTRAEGSSGKPLCHRLTGSHLHPRLRQRHPLLFAIREIRQMRGNGTPVADLNRRVRVLPDPERMQSIQLPM